VSIERITHLIGGTPWTGVSERTSKVYNPATGEVTGELDLASAATVD
jgi:malonate-semialdehyde dehydrogenase (acetylating)/methylmalonate-semialdehyde dehydrogenase